MTDSDKYQELLKSYSDPNTKFLDDATMNALMDFPIPMMVYCPMRPMGKKLLLVSDGCCKMLGFDRAGFNKYYSEHPHDVMHPDDVRNLTSLETSALLNPNQEITAHLRMRNAMGGYTLIAGQAYPHTGPYGHIMYYFHCSDITNESEYVSYAKSSLKNIDTFLGRILDTTKSAIYWKDVHGRFMGANQSFMDYCSVSSQELVGKTSKDITLLSGSNLDAIDDDLILQGKSIERVHVKIIRHGEPRDLVVTKAPLMYGGKIIGIVGSFDDISNESSLQRRIQYLNSILDNISTGVALYHLRHGVSRCITTNSALRRQLNITEEDLCSEDYDDIIFQLIHPDDMWQMKRTRQLIEAERTSKISCTYRIYPKGSSKHIWMYLSTECVRNSDDDILMYVTFTDITAEKAAEQALLESQIAYETAADATGMAIWTYDIKNDIRTFMDNKVSKQVRKKYKFPKVIRNDSQLMYAEADPSCKETLDDMYDKLRQGQSTSYDILMNSHDENPVHWERIIYSVVSDENGVPTVAYGLGIDITQEKLRSQQYEQELEQLHNLSQANIIAKAHFNLTAGTVLEYISSSTHSMPIHNGDSYNSFCNTLLSMLTKPDEQEKLSALLSKDNLIEKFAMGKRSFTVEYHRRNEYMTPILVESTISTFTGKDGDIECFFQSYDMTSNFMGDVIATKLADLGYTQMSIINLVTDTMTYYSRETGVIESTPEKPLLYETVLRAQLCAGLGNEKGEKVFEKLTMAYIIDQLDGKNMYEFSFDFPDSDGQLTRKRMQCCYLDSTQTSIFIAQSDITEQYRVERQRLHDLHEAITAAEKANDTKAMFLSGISHDMRTPLNGIISFTNFALETDEENKRQDYLLKIKQSGALLLNLVNDTLNLTRIESGKVSLELNNVDFNDLMETITTSIQVAADERNINFHVEIDPALPRMIRTDKLKMQEICLNLLSNAVKFTYTNGYINFKFTYMPNVLLENNTKRVSSCRILVQDNGIGMSPEFLPKLFDPFAQEYSPEIANPTGTGLGLSIVKRYIEMMGGTIHVESQQGIGTTFTVNLPWEEVNLESAGNAPEAAAEVDFSNLSVLLTEDNILNQEIATMLLEDKGIKVTLANNGREAVDIFMMNPANTFDLILMDIRMPVMTGYEATATIRHLHRDDAGTIPIIAMTADAYQEDIKRCMEAGMQAHVVKPINPTVLFREISRACNIK